MRCLYCEKDTSNPKYCSLSCSAKYQHANAVKSTKVRYCEQCAKPFKYVFAKRFCTKSCSATHNNMNRLPRFKEKNQRFNFCDCGKQVSLYASRCLKCLGADKKEARVNAWLSGEWNATTTQGLASSIKRYLIKQAGYKCTLCGWNEINPVTERSPLEVDHIDGDCYNNRPENLQVLCPNCHALTPTYKGLNKNSKRKYRTAVN